MLPIFLGFLPYDELGAFRGDHGANFTIFPTYSTPAEAICSRCFSNYISDQEKKYELLFSLGRKRDAFKVFQCANIGTRLELMPQVARKENRYKMTISKFQNKLRDHPLKV